MAGPDLVHEQRLAQDRLLGWSLTCPATAPGVDIGRDLVLATGPNGVDLARVNGMDTLTQSLTIALTTRLGDDVFNVAFGFDGLNALVEEQDPVLIRERLRIAVIQVLRKEPRVRRIVDVKLGGGQLQLTDEGTFVETGAADGRRELNIAVAFEVISGEQVNLNLGAIGIHG
jgi:phage baseplate assembly protein W